MCAAGRLTVKDLYYARQHGWHPLPEWASFFAAAGAAVATHNSATLRLIIGVALPTRAFSAALAATEVVITRSAINRDACDDGRDLHNRFEELCQMAQGTSVILLNPPTNRASGVRDRKLKGVISECVNVNGEQRLKITVDAGGGNYQIAAKDSWRVEPASTPKNLPKRQTGQLVAPVKAFARQFLGEDAQSSSRPVSRLDCVLLGRVSQIEREVLGVNFALKQASGEFEQGTLQDILRARRFVTGDALFHSEVLRVDGSKPAKSPGGLAPHVTVFDGARGFLRWRHLWRDTNWIVLLDRTAPHFDEAASALNTDFIQNRVNNSDVLDHIPVPPGIEVMAYTATRPK